MGLCAFGTLLFALAPNLLLANIAFFLVGFSGAFAFVGSLVIAARWFPPQYFALNVGIVQFMGCVGAIVGQAPIAYAAGVFGWRHTTLVFALIGFLGMLLMAILIRDRSQGSSLAPAKKMQALSSTHQMSEFARLKQVMSKMQNWWAAIYAFGIWSPIVLFAGLFGIPFLVVRFSISPEQAALASILLWLGVGLGNAAFGWWSDYISSRKLPMIICAVIGLLSSLILIYYPSISILAMYILLFFFGLASSGQAVSFGVIKDINNTSVAGTAIGFQNMAVIIGGTILQPIAGTILKHMWDGAMFKNAPAYSVHDYHYALALVPISSIIALLASCWFIKETHCHSQHDENTRHPDSSVSSADLK
jgi:MFS family permease